MLPLITTVNRVPFICSSYDVDAWNFAKPILFLVIWIMTFVLGNKSRLIKTKTCFGDTGVARILVWGGPHARCHPAAVLPPGGGVVGGLRVVG